MLGSSGAGAGVEGVEASSEVLFGRGALDSVREFTRADEAGDCSTG